MIKRKLVIYSDVSHIGKVREAFLADLKEYNIPEGDVFNVRLSLEEALMNAIKHGNKNQPDQRVVIQWQLSARKIVITIRDQGKGFDPGSVPSPVRGKRLFQAGGRGLFLIKKIMDRVLFNRKGNSVTLVKHFSRNSNEKGE